MLASDFIVWFKEKQMMKVLRENQTQKFKYLAKLLFT